MSSKTGEHHTLSLREGVDDYTLAQWAGRTRIEDNRHYDHRTEAERNNELQLLARGGELTTLDKFRGNKPVTFKELGVDRRGAAIPTLYGMCVHDYAMTPCMKGAACMTCSEHVCIKGDPVRLGRIKNLEKMTEQCLDKARQHDSDSDAKFGTNQWVHKHMWELAHVRVKRKKLEDKLVADGTLLRIPDEYDPSPVRRALMDLNLIDAPSGPNPQLPIQVHAIEGPDDA